MQITEIHLDNQITHIALAGKLDVPGVHAVDVKFQGYTAARRRPTLVDLSGVEMITSLGMGMFISAARALQRVKARNRNRPSNRPRPRTKRKRIEGSTIPSAICSAAIRY